MVKPEASLALLASSRCPGTVIAHGLDIAIALKEAPVTIVSGFQSPVNTISRTRSRSNGR